MRVETPTCEQCDRDMRRDSDGSGAEWWFCPDCGETWEDPMSPVAVTERLFDFARRNGLME